MTSYRRPVLGRFYGLFRAISLIVGIFFMFSVFGKSDSHYVSIFIGIGLIYGLGFVAMCARVKEGDYPPPPVDDDGPPSSLKSAKTYLRDCFAKPYYYWVFAALILPNLAFTPINAFNLYFSQSVGMTTDRYGKLQAHLNFCRFPRAVPFGPLADRFHPARLAIGALILHGAASLSGGFFLFTTRRHLALPTCSPVGLGLATTTRHWPCSCLPERKSRNLLSVSILSTFVGISFDPLIGRMLDVTHNAYRYTYIAGGILDAAGLIVTIVVFRKFIALGATKGYVAPQ